MSQRKPPVEFKAVSNFFYQEVENGREPTGDYILDTLGGSKSTINAYLSYLKVLRASAIRVRNLPQLFMDQSKDMVNDFLDQQDQAIKEVREKEKEIVIKALEDLSAANHIITEKNAEIQHLNSIKDAMIQQLEAKILSAEDRCKEAESRAAECQEKIILLTQELAHHDYLKPQLAKNEEEISALTKKVLDGHVKEKEDSLQITILQKDLDYAKATIADKDREIQQLLAQTQSLQQKVDIRDELIQSVTVGGTTAKKTKSTPKQPVSGISTDAVKTLPTPEDEQA